MRKLQDFSFELPSSFLCGYIGVIIGMSGFSVLESESRGDKLWLPTGTRAQEDYVSGYPVCCVCCVVLCVICRQRSKVSENGQIRNHHHSFANVHGKPHVGGLRPLANTL